MNEKKKIVIVLLLVLVVTGVCIYRFSPTGRVKGVVRAYNRWSDPGLLQPKQGLGDLIRFFFLNLFASNRLEALLADDCRITYVRPDGGVVSEKGRAFVTGLTGLRFSSGVEQVILIPPEIIKQQDEYHVSMTKAFYEGNNVMSVDAELVIRNIDGSYLISSIKRTGRQPGDEELNRVKSITHAGRYDYHKGLSGRYAWFYPEGLDYSPDGTRIVFTAIDEKGNLADICLVNADGTGRVPLAESKYSEVYPRFTPDGQNILFYCDRENYAGEPYLIDIDGSNCRRLLPQHDGVSDVVFSPDGKYIAFTVRQGLPKEVYLMKTNDSEITQLTHSARENSGLLFSPDGSTLYFKQAWYVYENNPPLQEEIFVVDVEEKYPRQLTRDRKRKMPIAASEFTLFYSKNTGKNNDYKNELWMVKPDGSENKAVMNKCGHGNCEIVKLMPDRQAIVLIDDLNREFNYQVYLKYITGKGNLVQLTHYKKGVINFAVSPDGKEIIYNVLPDNITGRAERAMYRLPIESGKPVYVGKNCK